MKERIVNCGIALLEVLYEMHKMFFMLIYICSYPARPILVYAANRHIKKIDRKSC